MKPDQTAPKVEKGLPENCRLLHNIFKNACHTTFTIETNTMNPDQTAPKGAG